MLILVFNFLVFQSYFRGRGGGCFTLIAFLMSCDCLCSVAHHHGAIGRSTVCN